MHLLLMILYNLAVPNYNYVLGVLLYQLAQLGRTKTPAKTLTKTPALFLKYAPVSSIIGWQIWEPDWCS